MAAISWVVGTSGNWSTKSDWSTGAIPGALDDVTVANPGTYTVLINTVQKAHSLTVNDASATVYATSTLTLGTKMTLSAGKFLLGTGGVVQGGTVAVGAAGTFSVGGGTLSAVTFQGTLNEAALNASLTINDGLTMTGMGGTGKGVINLTGVNATLYLDADGINETLNSATLNIGNTTTNDTVDNYSDGGTITLGGSFTLNQSGKYANWQNAYDSGVLINQGTIVAGVSGGRLTIGGETLINQGLIAVSNGDSLDLSASTVSNSGTLTVTTGGTLAIGFAGNTGFISETNATLLLYGAFTTAQLGTITRSGGDFGIDGTLTNTGATLSVGAGTTLGTLDLQSAGVIVGGTIADAGGGILADGGTLSAVTYQGAITLSAANATLTVNDGLTIGTAGSPGTINVTGAGADLYFGSDGTNETLNNVTLNIGSGSSYSYFDTESSTLTLGASFSLNHTGTNVDWYFYSNTIINQGTIQAGLSGGQFSSNGSATLSNQGLIAVSNGDSLNLSQATLSNAGTVTVTTGGTLAIGLGSNTGSLSETNSTLLLYGAYTAAQLATVGHSGGDVGIDGTLTNTGATLSVGSGTTLGALDLQSSGSIVRGTIADAGGGILADGGTLSAVTYDGIIDLSAASATLSINDGVTISGIGGTGPGTINLTGTSASLYLGSDGTNETLNNATLNIGSTQGSYEVYNEAPTLTLGTNFSLDHVATYALWYNYGDTVINQGTIQAGLSGGDFAFAQGGTFINQGLIAVSNGDSLDLSGVTVSNLTNSKLTGGTWSVSGPSTLELTTNLTVATLAANVTLSGAGSLIQAYNSTSGKQFTFDSTLTTIATTGTLHLLGGRGLTTTRAVTDQGLLELRGGTVQTGTLTVAAGATIVGYGTLNAALADSGLIEANGGLLKLASTTGGTAGFQVDAGATLEIAGTTAQAVAFNGLGATLRLDSASGFTGALTGLSAGDTFALPGITVTGAVITNGTLAIAVSGGGTLDYAVSGALANTDLVVTGGTNSLVTVYDLAQTSGHTPEPVTLANHHVGDTDTQELSITNAAPANGYSENLDASLSGGSAGVLASGSFTGLAAGGTNGAALTIGIITTTTGLISGTGTITLASDGAGVDGNGTTALAPQIVDVSGGVYGYAAPVFSTGTLNLGATRVGGATLSGSDGLQNGTGADGYQEALVYGLSGNPALALINATGTIASGGSVSIGVSLATGTAGDFTGTALSANLVSSGSGTSGLGNTQLTSQTVTVNAKVYAAAIAQLGTTALSFGVVHVGDTISQAVLLTNAASGALTDLLTGGTATLSGAAGSVGFAAIGSGLATGASANLSVGLATGSSGVVSGSVVLGFTSHDTDLADLAIAGGTVTVAGTVDNYATAEVEKVSGTGTLSQSGIAFTLNLGAIAQNSSISVGLGVLNAAGGLADLLGGSFTISGSSAFTNTGFAAFSGLGAGQAETAQTVALATTATGTFTETIVVGSAGSNASGYYGALAGETITVTGTVTSAGGQTFTLTTGIDTVAGGAGNNTINAGANTLNSRDAINGGSGGANVMNLTGTGVWDLGAPKTLTGVQTVNVSDAGSGGVVYLRDGLNVALTVAGGGAGNLTVYGGADSSVMTLGGGADTVTLGAATETVVAGTGKDLVHATAATAGALFDAAAGSSNATMQVSGGGTITLNNGDANLIVQLLSASTLMLGTASFITATGSTGADTILAGGANQVIGGGAGADTLVGGTGFATIFRDTSANLNGDLIQNFGGASLVDVTDLSFAAHKTPTVTNTGTGNAEISTLHVTDGTHAAAIRLSGAFSAASFSAASDGHSGTQFAFVAGH